MAAGVDLVVMGSEVVANKGEDEVNDEGGVEARR